MSNFNTNKFVAAHNHIFLMPLIMRRLNPEPLPDLKTISRNGSLWPLWHPGSHLPRNIDICPNTDSIDRCFAVSRVLKGGTPSLDSTFFREEVPLWGRGLGFKSLQAGRNSTGAKLIDALALSLDTCLFRLDEKLAKGGKASDNDSCDGAANN